MNFQAENPQMRTIGVIGGMSWESTALYYQAFNREANRRLGHLHSAPVHLISLDFESIASRQRRGDWDGMTAILVEAARQLERSGAGCVLIATNTMHRVAPAVQAAIGVPLLHIADTTAGAIRSAGLHTVGLLGTRFTMEESFYRDRLAGHGVRSVVPEAAERDEVHRIIFEELCKGRITAQSRATLVEICTGLAARGAQGIVLGCTELPMILGEGDVALPLFDTATLHALAAVAFALAPEEVAEPA